MDNIVIPPFKQVRIMVTHPEYSRGLYANDDPNNIKESLQIDTTILPRPADTFRISKAQMTELEDRMFENWKAYPGFVTRPGDLWDTMKLETLDRRYFSIKNYCNCVREVIFDTYHQIIWIVLSNEYGHDSNKLDQILNKVEQLERRSRGVEF